jgi:hypothetical protein
VRDVSGTCAADGSGLIPGGVDCRPPGFACSAGACVTPLFYDGFERAALGADWTVNFAGSSPPVPVAGGAMGTANSFTCVGCQVTHSFATAVRPSYVGFWTRTAQMDFIAQSKRSTWDVFVVRVDNTDAKQSVALSNNSDAYRALGRWPSVRTAAWSLVELRNIDWTLRTFDFYYNGDLLMAQAPLGSAAGVDEVVFRVSGRIVDHRIDELVIN